MGKLTARQCASLAPGKYSDGNGLWLVVAPSGARKWVCRVVVAGKRREMGLGTYGTRSPGVTLAEARQKAAEAQTMVRMGQDPVEERRRQEAVQEPIGVPAFTTVAARFIRSKRHEWSNPKHARQWVSTLKSYARPFIGARRVDDISTEDVLAILKPLWTAKPETGKRVQGRIEAILDYAAAMKWRDGSNPARWRGHLDKLLPAPAKVKRMRNGGAVAHHPAMPYERVPAFLAEVRALKSISSMALELLILTATRTSEVLQATWSEVDMEAATWLIPASRTKTRQAHQVPLSEAAMAVLERVPRVAGNPYIFPGARHGRPLSNMALLQVMRGLGYGVSGERGDAVPHGFRSAFRDWSGEVSHYPRDVCEMALGHAIENKVEAAYRRGALLAKRRNMMQDWSAWCGRGAVNNVVELRQTA